MNLPPRHEPPGLETRLLRAWPWALAFGTVLPALVALAIGLAFPEAGGHEALKKQWIAWYVLAGAVVFYWTAVPTVAIGCWIVRVMKGPVRECDDAYPLPRRDLFEL